MGKRRIQPFPKAVEDMIFSICRMFFSGDYNAEEIAALVNEELKRRGRAASFNRQQVYPVLMEAVRRNYIRFCPPAVEVKAQRLADLYRIPIENIRVVRTSMDEKGLEDVASEAANLAMSRIIGLAKKKRREDPRAEVVEVHIGLGAGLTTMMVARHLGMLLRSQDEIEGYTRLVVHNLSSGFLPDKPLTSPTAYYSFFQESRMPIDWVGLISPPVVHSEDYEKTKNLPGVREALQRGKEIEIAITSLGCAKEGHGLLVQIEKLFYADPNPKSEVTDRRGDVMFKPYSETGPLDNDPTGVRAVTVLEIQDFVDMVKDGKEVILVSGPQLSGMTRTTALMPLLNEPNLRVWSHLCMDLTTAEEVIQNLQASQKPTGG